jgi:hypothetical protein
MQLNAEQIKGNWDILMSRIILIFPNQDVHN